MITQERIKELLHYNSETGVFTWRVSRGMRKVGDLAGTVYTGSEGKSYIQIQVDFKLYRAHRLSWLYMYGAFPSRQIDHINGNGVDNRISNLRSVTHSENSKNRRLQSNNVSGACGVYWNKAMGKWVAFLNVDLKRVYLGCFTVINDAIAARRAAEIEHGFHENHGESRALYGKIH